LHKIAAILGYGVGSGLDLVTGFKEWSSKTLKRIEYGLLIPKTLAGSDGICNSAWTYYQDERIGQIAQFMPILVWGVPNPILETNKNGELKIRLKLTLNNKMLPEQKVPIIFSQLINK
jgi:hypothetical protein